MKWIRDLKRESEKKFRLMPAESSETFRHQTFFKDFGGDLPRRELTDSPGYEIEVEGCEPEIAPILAKDLGPFAGWMGRADDRFVHMNNAFFESGVVIETLPNERGGMVRVGTSEDGGVFRKIVVIARENSKIDIVKESAHGDAGKMVSESVLVVAGDGADVSFSELQNYGSETVCFSDKTSVCMRGSKVSWNTGVFGGSRARTRSYNLMRGEGAQAEDFQLMFGSGAQEIDSFSNLVHVGRSTSGKSMTKGVFSGDSKSLMKGMIRIEEGAKNSNAYLASHGMLLSKSAKCNAVPGLEIETDDVKATHSASVSPMDEEKVFYMRCRGVPEAEARKMLAIGFFDPLIARMGSREIQAKMRYLVESKWGGSGPEIDEKALKEFMNEDAIKAGEMFEGHYKYRR